MRYINLRFTYLLAFIYFTPPHPSPPSLLCCTLCVSSRWSWSTRPVRASTVSDHRLRSAWLGRRQPPVRGTRPVLQPTCTPPPRRLVRLWSMCSAGQTASCGLCPSVCDSSLSTDRGVVLTWPSMRSPTLCCVTKSYRCFTPGSLVLWLN